MPPFCRKSQLRSWNTCLGKTYHRDGDLWRMRQDELDLIELLSPPPVLDSRGPSVAGVAQTMGKDDSGRMTTDGREDQGRGSTY